MTDSRIPADALEGLMKKVFIDGSIQPGLFWDAVLKAKLYLPVSLSVSSDEIDLDSEMHEWPLKFGMDSSGNQILWMFTSIESMEEYTDKKFKTIEIEGQQAFEKAKDMPKEIVLIGPGKMTLSLDTRLVESLAQGKVPLAPPGEEHTVPRDKQVMVGAPKDTTEELEDAFIGLFENKSDVLEAAFIQVSDSFGSRLLLGLKLEKENRDELKRVAGLVAKAAEGVLDRGKTMDVTLINGSLKGAFDKWGKIFYKKSQT